MKPIVILQTGSAPAELQARFGDFGDWFKRDLQADRHGLRVELIDLQRGDPLPQRADEASGYVITGSAAMVTDRPAWSEAAADWLRAQRETLPPTLGVCYGHQLMNHAWGGVVANNGRGRIMGSYRHHCLAASADHVLMRHLPTDFWAQKSHCQRVLEPAPGAQTLIESAGDPYAALYYGPGHISVQFHPEFDVAAMHGYIEARASALSAEGIDIAASKASVRPAFAATELLRRFSEQIAASQGASS